MKRSKSGSGFRRAATILVCVTGLIGPPVARAHLAVSTRSLRTLSAESDLVVRARLLDIEQIAAGRGNDELKRSVLRIRVLKVLKGPPVEGDLRFAQHGHGVAEYRRGQEALFFLQHISESRELAGLGEAAGLSWYSDQEHQESYVLTPKSRKSTLAAARAYIRAGTLPTQSRPAALRTITVDLLSSDVPQLAESALRDLVTSGGAPWVTSADVPKLTRVIDDATTPIGIRVGLLTELERRELVRGNTHWLRLLRSTQGTDRIAVIRAARAHPSTELTSELVLLLSGPDGIVAAEAAMSLGTRGNTAAIGPLDRAMRSSDRRVAMAAVRALAAIGTKEAYACLGDAAASHDDAGIRRRAAAELRLREESVR